MLNVSRSSVRAALQRTRRQSIANAVPLRAARTCICGREMFFDDKQGDYLCCARFDGEPHGAPGGVALKFGRLEAK